MNKVNKNSGFTMIETLVVMAIMGIIAVGGIYKVINAQEKSALSDASSSVVRMVEDARSGSASGRGTLPHGVYVESNGIIIFEGNSYAAAVDETKYYFHPAVSSDQSGTEVLFARYSATPSNALNMQLTGNSGDNITIQVNSSGAITVSE